MLVTATERVAFDLQSLPPPTLRFFPLCLKLVYSDSHSLSSHGCASSGRSEHMGSINTSEPTHLLISHPDRFSILCP